MVSIQKDSGEVKDYLADTWDGDCFDDRPLISNASIAPFLDTLPCSWTPAGNEVAPTLDADTRCFNGFAFGKGGASEQRVDLAEPGRTYHLELSSCISTVQPGEVTMQLFGSDPSTPLAQAQPLAELDADHTCLAMTASVAEPVHDARVVVTAGPSPSTSGFHYLRFY
jgi:hypothetical protein